MTLGAAIREAREAKHMTLRALATLLEVSAPYLTQVEQDARSVSDAMLGRIAIALDVEANALFALRSRWSRELAEWIKSKPDLVELLHEARRTGRTLRIDE